MCGHAWCIPCAAPFRLRSPPRYSGARRPVPRVLILDSSLRVGLGRRREAESHLSSSPSWRGTLRLAKPMHRDNLPRREMSHTHTHTGATWTCVPVGVTRGGSHATFASRAAARVGRLRRGALRLAVLGALLLVRPGHAAAAHRRHPLPTAADGVTVSGCTSASGSGGGSLPRAGGAAARVSGLL